MPSYRSHIPTNDDGRIQAILDTAVDGIITIDDHGIIESANPAIERLFGYAPAELIGRNVSVLMPSPHRERHDEYIAGYLRTGEARVIGIGRELEGLRRDGTTFPMELAISEVRGGDRPRFAGIIRDITARKQAEAALLRADALKDEFLANTSHELRTPLNGIIGIGQSMLDGATGSLTDEQRRNLEMVVASGRRLADLVNDLLDFSKLRHETIELHCGPTDLHSLVELVLAVSRTLIGKRPLRLFNRTDPAGPLAEVDENRIQQVLFNLVGNAIKFTPAGTVEVSAEVQNDWLDVTVADTGIGIMLGDQVQRVMTVLFADIRDFTRLAEKMSPEHTFEFVNQYLGAVGPAIARHRGVIDKFVGDAVMAFFPERAEDAIDAALDMFRQLGIFNRERAERGEPPIEIGIGFHTGVLMLGTIGAADRIDTTVISEAVNLASRVENLTKTYQVPLIITEAIHSELRDASSIALRRIDRVLVQGKSQPVVLYEVMDADTPERRTAKLSGLPDLEVGLAYYEASDFTSAIDAFERALAALPTDSVVQVLLERAKRLAVEVAPAGRAAEIVARLEKS